MGVGGAKKASLPLSFGLIMPGMCIAANRSRDGQPLSRNRTRTLLTSEISGIARPKTIA